ncbi:MAG TPA: HAMP domain-containing sensor histidine kinase [Salinivirga sp.]|uniref:sensor histidine kinase n=1 Tax=Salinivirga sp. TaxID=1970192 RepID=UPI002B46BA71|nr:HAMP domain-containing sensor histidine kinase [Salinivirga sp.]HKK60254.1 HAMP domain-containing sensor histidine kinase [Salinivirga sp.]
MEKKISDEDLIKELKIRFDQNKKALTELQEKSKELRKVNEKLKESESLKSHFLSNVTNEIVNPFASILGLSQSIMALNITEYEKIKPLAQLIHAEAFNLDFQLKNIFAAAKIEAGLAQPELTNVNIQSLIESIIESYKYKAQQKELKIKFHYQANKKENNSKEFPTDSEKLKLIMSNLLNNSIKYSNAAQKIEIVSSVSKEDELIITVKDYGVGIKKEDQEKLFDRFVKGESTIHSLNEGYGLGLSVTKSYVDSLEGKITVESEQNKGAVFTIYLPRPKDTSYLEGFSDDGNEIFFQDTDEEF